MFDSLLFQVRPNSLRYRALRDRFNAGWCFIRGWLKQKLFDVICTEVGMAGAQGIKSPVKFARGLHQWLS
jgi:hypothetical protein